MPGRHLRGGFSMGVCVGGFDQKRAGKRVSSRSLAATPQSYLKNSISTICPQTRVLQSSRGQPCCITNLEPGSGVAFD